jgi:hypothetical protein
MRVQTRLLIPAIALLLQACGGDPATAAATGASSTAPQQQAKRERISCAEFFGELREGVLGHLRGTESLSLIKHVTGVAASTYASGNADESVKVPDSMCGMFGRSLRKERKPASQSANPLAPACAAFVERIDRDCLQPLVQRGEALNQACSRKLIALSGLGPDRTNTMQNDSYCQDL